MKFTIMRAIHWQPCRSLWQMTRAPGPLPQQQMLSDFIQQHSINDVNLVRSPHDIAEHDMQIMIFDQRMQPLQIIISDIQRAADHARSWLWISLNVYLVYTLYNQDYEPDVDDWDLKIIHYIEDHLHGWRSVFRHHRPDDRGRLGNFEYPVTALALQRS